MADENKANTEVTLSLPTESGDGTITDTFSHEDWIGFCQRLNEYAGEEFLTGADSDKLIYERLMALAHVEVTPIEAPSS